MIAILILQLLITYDIDINKYLSPRTLNQYEKTVKEMDFISSNNQKKAIWYDRKYIHHRIYLVLRAIIKSYLRQENFNPPLELIKRARGVRNQISNPDVRHIFKEDLDEGVTFEDDDNNKIKLKNLG